MDQPLRHKCVSHEGRGEPKDFHALFPFLFKSIINNEIMIIKKGLVGLKILKIKSLAMVSLTP